METIDIRQLYGFGLRFCIPDRGIGKSHEGSAYRRIATALLRTTLDLKKPGILILLRILALILAFLGLLWTT